MNHIVPYLSELDAFKASDSHSLGIDVEDLVYQADDMREQLFGEGGEQ